MNAATPGLRTFLITLLCVAPVLAFAQLPLLVEPRIENLTGFTEDSKVTLEWKLSAVDQLKSIVIEKSDDAVFFDVAGEIVIKESHHTFFHFENIHLDGEKVYYRLKLVTLDGETGYSRVLPFRLSDNDNTFSVFPSVVKNDMILRIKSEKRTPGTLRIINYSGTVVRQKLVPLQEGMNSIFMDQATSIAPGNYVAVLEVAGRTSSQKIVKL